MADAMGSVYRWQVAYVYGYMVVTGVLLWIWFAQGVYKDARCDIGGFSRFGGSGKGGSPGIYVEVFKIAVKTLVADVDSIMQKNNIAPKDITYFIPHQANLRIINAVGERLSFQKEQIVLSVQKYGNTSAASIPMAMNDVYEAGNLKNGDLMLLDAIGGGLTWGSALVYFDGK